MYTNFETFAKLILFINLTMSVVSCTIKPYEESTDMQRRNLKGNVCLVIEQTVRIEDDKEIEEPISILKFNRYGNLLSDSRERTKYTYDGNGNLLVKRKEDYTYFMGEGLKAMYTYWKYEYDKNYFVTKIKEYEEYDSDNKILSSCQIFARDKYHYVTKSITISNRFDYNVRKMYTDSVEVQYQYNTKGDIIRTKESNGKRILETSYKINQRGLIEMKHSKDLLVYVDSVPYYKISGPLSDYSSDPMSGDPSGYSYEYMNTNQLYLYEYDERDNVIHIHFCDSTNNTQNDIYKKYTYDEYVEGIFVSGEMQSQGIGKILLNYAKDKRNKLYLNVYQKNARAISFYKREEFEIQHSGLDEATGEKDYVMTRQYLKKFRKSQ